MTQAAMTKEFSNRPNSIKDLTDVDFKKVVIESKESFIIQIQADWCGECYIMSSILQQTGKQYSDLHFGTVNVDWNKEITQEFGVTELPFILFFKNGELVDHLIGLQSKKIIEHHLENMMLEK